MSLASVQFVAAEGPIPARLIELYKSMGWENYFDPVPATFVGDVDDGGGGSGGGEVVPCSGPECNDIKAMASNLINDSNSGLGTKAAMTEIANKGCGTSGGGSTAGQCIPPSLKLMQFITSMKNTLAQSGIAIKINAVMDGDHSPTSNHYKNPTAAVDFACYQYSDGKMVPVQSGYGIGTANHTVGLIMDTVAAQYGAYTFSGTNEERCSGDQRTGSGTHHWHWNVL